MFIEEKSSAFNFKKDDNILFQYPIKIDEYSKDSDHILKKSIDSAVELMVHFVGKKDEDKDERLLVVLGLLLIEREINRMLVNLNIDPSFANSTFHKINLLKSMNLIPSELFEICTLINNIRNKFSHNLEVDYLSHDKVKGYMSTLRGFFKCFYPDGKDNYDDYNYFRGITYQTHNSLISYNWGIHIYGEKIREPSLIEEISK